VDVHTAVDFAIAAAAIGSAVVAEGYRRRHRADLAAIAKLKQALTGAHPQIPGIAIGSVVLSASPGTTVGGDIVDVFELDARFTMLLVADISGKGLAAAAHAAFVKYTIRTLALEDDGDPAVVLAKFNAMFARANGDFEGFVVLILGIIDSQTGEVRYASAGHEPAFIRRSSGRVTMLEPTGPIVGAAGYSAYRTATLTLDLGDVLVWTTDGMTESRDRRRRLLGCEGLASWIASAPADVLGIADWLIAALRRRSGDASGDDVAVLAVAYEPVNARSRKPRLQRDRAALGRAAPRDLDDRDDVARG
jgi:sigma-B regulation protein RsbU (phosphoserine phosphatase)